MPTCSHWFLLRARPWCIRWLLILALLSQMGWMSAGVAEASNAPRPIAQVEFLSISKTASPDPVNLGDLLTYNIVVTNTGTVTATQVIVTDTVPAGAVFESATVLYSGGANWFWGGLAAGDTGNLVWLTGDRWFGWASGLPAGNAAVLQMVVRVIGPVADQGVITNDNYRASAFNRPLVIGTPPVTTTVNAARFEISKIAASDTITAGARLQYTVTVTNSGHLTTAQPYTVVEALPPFTQYAAASPVPDAVANGMITWTLTYPLASGQAITTSFQVTVTAPLTNGLSLVNDQYSVASVEAASAVFGPPVTVTVSSTSALTITKSDLPDPVSAGGLLTYTLIVTNAAAANGPAQSVVITDRVPANTVYQSCNPSPCGLSSGVISSTLASPLAPGQSASMQLAVLVSSAVVSGTWITNGDYGVGAANQPSPAMGAPITTTVGLVDLVVNKQVSPAGPVHPNDWITYTVSVTNASALPAHNVVVTDRLPISLTNVTWATSPNLTFSSVAGNVYTWTAAIFGTGEMGRITITAQVITTSLWAGSMSVVNQAGAASDSAELTPADNTSSAAIVVQPGPVAQVTLQAVPDLLSVGQTSLVTATVADAYGNPVLDGTTVNFASSLFGSQVSPTSRNTINGVASVALTSTLVGTTTVTGVSSVFSGTTVVTFTFAQVHHFRIGPISSPQVAGVAFGIVITAEDQFNNVVTAFNNTVNLTDSTKTLTPTIVSTWVNGVANTSATVYTARVGDVITASLTTPLATGSSNAFNVVHNPIAASLSIAPQNQVVQAGNTVVYAATATDSFGNAWNATSQMTFMVSGGGTLGTPPGNNVFSATSPVGVYVVTATMPSATVTTTVIVTHGPAVSLTLTPVFTTVTAGTYVPYTAVATDALGNAWDATGQASCVGSGGNVFTGNVLSATVAGNGWPLTATLNAGVGTASITITHAALDHLRIGRIASPQTAGVDFSLVITAQDAFNNIVTDANPGVSLADSTGTIAPISTSNWSVGVATVAVSITQAMVGDMITATVTSPSLQATSNLFDVRAAAPFTVIYQAPGSLSVGGSATVTATVRDRFGNLVVNGTVVSLTAGIGLSYAQGNPYYPMTLNGVVTATLKAGCSTGTASVQAQSGAASSGPLSINVTSPGAPSVISMQALAALVVGSSGLVTATVSDGCGSVLSGQVVAFASDLGTSVAPVTGTTNASGLATTLLTAGSLTGTATITASVGSVVTHTTVIVSSQIFRIGLIASPQTAGGNFTVVITAYDTFNNVLTGFVSPVNLADRTGALVPASMGVGAWTNGVATTPASVTLAYPGDVITASIGGAPVAFSNPFDVRPGVPMSVAYAVPSTLPVQSTAPVSATIADQFGNRVADGAVVTLTAAAGLTYTQGNPYYPTTVNGVVYATLMASCSTGLISVQAQSGAVSPGPLFVNVTSPGALASISVQSPATLTVLSSGAVTATVRDGCGAAVSDQLVSFSSDLGTLVAPVTATSNVSGEATTLLTAGSITGTAIITASVGALSGAVSVQIVDAPRYHVFLPLVMRDYVTVATNLTLDSITVEPASPAVNQPAVVTVVVRNSGTAAIAEDFWVDLYLDPTLTPTVGVIWNSIAPYGKAWLVTTDLAPGATVALRSDEPDDPTNPDARYSNWPGKFLTAGSHNLWAVADSYGGPTGRVVETTEADNVFGPLFVTVTP